MAIEGQLILDGSLDDIHRLLFSAGYRTYCVKGALAVVKPVR